MGTQVGANRLAHRRRLIGIVKSMVNTHSRGSMHAGDPIGAIGLPHRERLATTAVFLANGLGIGAWAAALPRFKSDMVLTNAELSFVVLSFAVGAVAAMPLAGVVGSRVPTGPATCASGLAFTCALLLPIFAPSLTPLCIAALLVGAGNGAVDVLMNAHASGIEHRLGRPIMSSFHAAFSVGGVAGAVIGGWLTTAPMLAGLWVPSAIGSLLVLFAFGALGRQGQVTSAARLAMPSRALMKICWLALLCMMIEGAIADWSGAYLSETYTPEELVFTGYAAFSGCMVVGRLLGDRFVAWLGPPVTVRVGGVLATMGLIIVVATPSVLSGVIGFGLVGLGLSNVVPVVFSAASRRGGSAAAGVSMAATAGYAGFLLGPVAIGAVATLLSLRWSMAFLAVAAAVVGALGFALREARARLDA